MPKMIHLKCMFEREKFAQGGVIMCYLLMLALSEKL